MIKWTQNEGTNYKNGKLGFTKDCTVNLEMTTIQDL